MERKVIGKRTPSKALDRLRSRPASPRFVICSRSIRKACPPARSPGFAKCRTTRCRRTSAFLSRAGLISVEKDGRSMNYRADVTGFRGLLKFLSQDCCNGRPELCGDAFDLPSQVIAAEPTEKFMTPAFNVLFLCTQNSARSIIAEALLEKIGRGRFRAYSAGSEPAEAPVPEVIDRLKALGHDVSHLHSKSWDEFKGPDAPRMDFIIALCDAPNGQFCPDLGAQFVTGAWPLPDPAQFTGSADRAHHASERTLRDDPAPDRDLHKPPVRLAGPHGDQGAPRRDRRYDARIPLKEDPMKVGINGMGRIGRLALRAALGGIHRPESDPRADNRLEVVHINELKGGIAATAHLLEFDSIHGRWHEPIEVDSDNVVAIGKSRIGFSERASPGDVAWGDLGCDVVLECTGKFLKPDQLQAYFDRGVKRVIVAAPVKDEAALNIVVGVNDQLYDPARHRLLTAASCTTNCLAPVVKVIHEAIGIRHGQITTIHNPTNTNVVVDAPHKDLRRARSAMLSMQPTTTGSATAICADLSGTQGQVERSRRARSGPERQPDGLRIRTETSDHGRGGQSALQIGLGKRPGRHPRSGDPAHWSRPTTTTIRAARSSMP